MSIVKQIRPKLNNALKDILDTIGYTDTKVIYSDQNGLEPDNTYGVVNILNISQVGFRDESTLIYAQPDNLEFVTHHTISTQISFVGTEAGSVAYDFRQNMVNNRRCFEILMRSNFGIASRGDVRRIPQKRESAWVEAYNMDIDFTFSVFSRESYDWVEDAVVNEELIIGD